MGRPYPFAKEKILQVLAQDITGWLSVRSISESINLASRATHIRLKGLEDAGMVEMRLVEVVRNCPRKVFRISPAGLKVVNRAP